MKQTHTKRLLHLTDNSKDAARQEAAGFASLGLWCTQGTHQEFIPCERKGIRSPVAVAFT